MCSKRSKIIKRLLRKKKVQMSEPAILSFELPKMVLSIRRDNDELEREFEISSSSRAFFKY